jgi:predicted glycosyltransferase
MRVWIDLTNSPHVLVMRPIIELLRADGHEVRVTARDFAQTLQLLDRFAIEHTAIGHHRGERLGDKAFGLASRSTALVRWARRQSANRPSGAFPLADPTGVRVPAVPPLAVRPSAVHPSIRRPSAVHPPSIRHPARPFDIALGHGSNDVSVAARLLRIPCSTTFDYEWAAVQHQVNCRLAQAVVVPDAIPPERLDRYGAKGKIHAYEGLKEEYYLADFEPEEAVLAELEIDRDRPLVVVRTPPEVSLYHRFENDLFADVLARLRAAAGEDGVQSVVLPRTAEQRAQLRGVEGFTVPERAIDAQSLIAFADLVISAGGTMNREAVALGVPVYTTFEGRLGAVDERLIGEGRLRKLGAAEQLDLGKRGPGDAANRARRDPRGLVELLLSPLGE